MNFSQLYMQNKKVSQPNQSYIELDCYLMQYQVFNLKNCFILYQQTSSNIAESELLQLTQSEAERLSQHYTQNPHQFILIHSGKNIRRRMNWHAHIFIVKNRYHKSLIYQMLAIKNFGLIFIETLKKRCGYNVL